MSTNAATGNQPEQWGQANQNFHHSFEFIMYQPSFLLAPGGTTASQTWPTNDSREVIISDYCLLVQQKLQFNLFQKIV